MSPGRGKGRIVLVDDNASYREMAKAVFEIHGFDVVVAADVPSADAAIRGTRDDPPAVVLLDLWIDGEDGTELLRRFRRRLRGTRILVVTASFDIAFCVRAMRAGANDYVLKQWGFEVLVERVRAAVKVAKNSEKRAESARFLRGVAEVAAEKLVSHGVEEAGKHTLTNGIARLLARHPSDGIIGCLRWEGAASAVVFLRWEEHDLVAEMKFDDSVPGPEKLLEICEEAFGIDLGELANGTSAKMDFAGTSFGHLYAYRTAAHGSYASDEEHALRLFATDLSAVLAFVDLLSERKSWSLRSKSIGGLITGVVHGARPRLEQLRKHVMLPGSVAETKRDEALALIDVLEEHNKQIYMVGDFGLGREVPKASVDVAEVLQRAVREVRWGDLAYRGALTVEDTVSGEVVIDGRWLEHALHVLLRNSIEAMEANGDEQPRRIRISGENTGRMLELAFEDSGPGVPPAAKGTLFEWFKSQKEGGTGVGLPFARLIAEAFNGSLDFHPTDEGALFILRLPTTR